MISKEQEKVFKKLLGNYPSITILGWMAKQDPPILSRTGFPYSNAFIGQILNRKKENAKIEAAIWGCVKEGITKHIQEKSDREKILTNAIELTHEDSI